MDLDHFSPFQSFLADHPEQTVFFFFLSKCLWLVVVTYSLEDRKMSGLMPIGGQEASPQILLSTLRILALCSRDVRIKGM